MVHEEQRKTLQQQAQTKAQLARYEDELARKRMQVSPLERELSLPPLRPVWGVGFSAGGA